MKWFKISIFIIFIYNKIQAQDVQKSLSLNISDLAPQIRAQNWLKGSPVQNFKSGQIYVVEFWASWCKPCIAEIPKLSKLAKKYKEKVSILGISIYDTKESEKQRLLRLVYSLGKKIKYSIAVGDSVFMVTHWMNAAGESAIPVAFIINIEGKVSWIGHPSNLEIVLKKHLDGTWKTEEALAERNETKRLEKIANGADSIDPNI